MAQVQKISIPALHKLIFDKAAEYGKVLKVANANMKLIADPVNGWMELGKLFTSSLGFHETAIHKTSIGDLDVEATFNILKNLSIKIVPKEVSDSSGELVRFRHFGAAHKETRMSGESSTSSVTDIISGVRPFAELLGQHHHHVLNTENLYKKIDVCEKKIQDAIFDNMLILMQSRFVVPVLSQSVIDEWRNIEKIKYDPVLLYTCSGFAARDMAKCSRYMCSRVENIFPVIPSEILDSKKASQDLKKKSCCFPQFFNNGPSFRVFYGNPGNAFIKYEDDTSSSRIILKVDNSVIVCPNHCLSPNSCITLTGNLENVTVLIQGEAQKQAPRIFFVLDDGFTPDKFKMAISLDDKRPVLLQTANTTIGFKLASAQLFESFYTKTLSEAWQMIKNSDPFRVGDLNDSTANDASCFLKDKLKDKVCVPQDECACRLEILEIIPGSADATQSFGRWYLKPASEIVSLRVKILPDFNSEPLKQCKFHEIPQIDSQEMCLKVVGTCVDAKKVPGSDQEFFVELLMESGYKEKSFTNISTLCSCKYSQLPDDQLAKFQDMLQQSCCALPDIRVRIEKARSDHNWGALPSFKEEIDRVVKSKCAVVLGLPEHSVSDVANSFLTNCTSLYACVSSVRLKLKKIEDVKKLTVIQK
jgi:hypothetical protein